MRIILGLSFAAALMCASSEYAASADLAAATPIAPEEFEKRWHVAVGVYGWAAGLDADVGVAGLGPVDVNLSFGDILEDLDIAAMAVAEVRYDRFGVFADLFYTELSSSEAFLSGFVTADLTSSIFAGTLMGEYRVLAEGRSSLDAMAGARVWTVKGDLTVRTATGLSIERDDTESWVDPMVGVKARLQGDAPVFVTGWGMVGGFGVGSDFAWDVLGAVGYEVTDHISILAGYRAAGVDYSDDGFEFDATLHGPVVSGIIRF